MAPIPTPITLHHADQSKRLLWLLEELRLPYEIKAGSPNSLTAAVKQAPIAVATSSSSSSPAAANGSLPATSQQPAEQPQAPKQSSVYDKIAQAVASSLSGALPPTHSPTIVDNGLTIRESGAIVEYLIDKYGRGRFNTPNYASKLDDTFFMHYAEGSFMPPLVLKMVFSTILEKSPFFVRPFTSIVTNQICNSFIDPANFNNFRLVDSYLMKNGGRKYLAGGKEPTGGDFMMSFPIESAVTCGAFKPEDIPQSMKDYIERLKARPAYARVEALLQERAAEKKQ